MTYQPRFSYTDKIVSLLSRIEFFRGTVGLKTIPLHVSENMRYKAKLSSTYYSAVIEGSPLSFSEAENIISGRPNESEDRHAQEVRNYWRALTFLRRSKYVGVEINEEFIKRLHKIIEVRGPGRRGRGSEYRTATPPGYLFAVRDSVTKEVEYIPPWFEDVPGLMCDLVDWIKKDKSVTIPVKAAIAAYQLVTIHPFEDFNGRLTRALALYILMQGNYDLNGYFTVEEYYAKDLKRYYGSLQMGLPVNYYDGRNNPDLTPWITFFLETMEESFKTISESAIRLYEASQGKLLELSRKEIKLLQLALRFEGRTLSLELMAEWFDVTKRTMQDWVKDWVAIGLLEPASGSVRIRSYRLGSKYKDLKLEDVE